MEAEHKSALEHNYDKTLFKDHLKGKMDLILISDNNADLILISDNNADWYR